jgi:squalene-hopene/tetraprenyl-beta-curcumene cyclase
MERGVREYWGTGPDVEVCASFYLALLTYDRRKYAAAADRGGRYVVSQQKSDGNWDATWYWPRPYGIGLCLRLLRELGTGADAINRALNFLTASQRPDGGWGVWQTVPLDTALALWAFALAGETGPQADIKNALSALLRDQDLDGSWEATPWIKMDIGRAGGTVLRTATYQSITLTTAFCLRSLLLSRTWLRQT